MLPEADYRRHRSEGHDDLSSSGTMRHILHGWSDELCITTLAIVRRCLVTASVSRDAEFP
jgi:hypothetical protein